MKAHDEELWMCKPEVKGKNITLDLVAVLVASVAIGISIWQVIETRSHNQLAVTPYLGIWQQDQNIGEPGWMMVNNGMGPAFIIASKITYQEIEPINNLESYEKIGSPSYENSISWDSWTSIKNKLESKNKIYEWLQEDGLTCGDVLPPKGVVTFLGESKGHFSDAESGVIRLSINIEVCYCSIHGKCFHASPSETNKTPKNPISCPDKIDIYKLMKDKANSEHCNVNANQSLNPTA